ncbi:MAG: chemotaxis protein CheD [Rhodobacter sp.]|jgi:chemotaxis protein CheD|nr:chemotaxis protein CheD [Rhodobacter sp.]
MIAAGQKAILVIQGEFRVLSRPDEVLSTILGSCVAACIWDEGMQLGGMNHFLLAQAQGDPAVRDNRYGVHAMEMLINGLLRAGARRDRLKAKLFGGAKIAANLRDIGTSNADFARGFLKTEGIPCLAESLGGTQARRVLFQPATGLARQLLIPNEAVDEKPQRTPPPGTAASTGIELF